MTSRIFLILIFLFLEGFAEEQAHPFLERIHYLRSQKQFYPKHEQFIHWIAGGEFLYWKADVDGVAYATTSKVVQANGLPGTLNTHVKTRTPHFSYDPGFRLMLGMQSPFDLFDIVLVWTRFYTEGHDHAHVRGDKVIDAEIGMIKQPTSIPNQAKTEVHFKGNLLDAQFGRGIKISENFFFRPYFGVRGVWSDIDWDITVTRNFLFPDPMGQDATRLKVDNDLNAVGGLFGLNVEWKMPMGFGIYSRAAGALVYGRTKESTRQDFIFVPPLSEARTEQDYRARNSFHSVKGMWELFGGLYWQSWHAPPKKNETPKKHLHVRLVAGYEFQQWPLMAQKTNIQFSRERERFSLGFQGFTGGIWLIY